MTQYEIDDTDLLLLPVDKMIEVYQEIYDKLDVEFGKDLNHPYEFMIASNKLLQQKYQYVIYRRYLNTVSDNVTKDIISALILILWKEEPIYEDSIDNDILNMLMELHLIEFAPDLEINLTPYGKEMMQFNIDSKVFSELCELVSHVQEVKKQ